MSRAGTRPTSISGSFLVTSLPRGSPFVSMYSIRKKRLRLFQLRPPRHTQSLSRSIYKIVQHSQAGNRSLWRDLLRGEGSCNRRSALGKKSFGWTSRVSRYARHPSALPTRHLDLQQILTHVCCRYRCFFKKRQMWYPSMYLNGVSPSV